MNAPLWIGESDALALHGWLQARHSGQAGLRDAAMLRAILEHPREHFAYAGAADIAELAAAYMAGITRNRPFTGGNARTGFLLGALFLELNGLRLTAPELEMAQALLALASGRLTELGLAAFLAENVAAMPE